MKILVTLIGVLVLATGTYAYEKTEKLTLPREGIDLLKIDCGSGFLIVEGKGETIEVTAEIQIDGWDQKEAEEFIKKTVTLVLKKTQSTAFLRSEIEQGHLYNYVNASINLTVYVPKDIALDIDDGSGSIKVTNMSSNVSIDDGSGNIDIHDITGRVTIDDGSGEIMIAAIQGDVSVEDGSGYLSITDIEGNVKVDDASGDIDIDRVSGNVTIVSEGSGGCRIRNVKGQVARFDD
ncbi:DUF4097 family beta strand repeat-containing protein [bacterium]|nr:DUF4097 family beta strand repeat-containing protein [bacterium]